MASEVLGKGGAAPAILNAANEVAVEAFLTGRLKFLHIAHLVAETLAQADARGLSDEADGLERGAGGGRRGARVGADLARQQGLGLICG